MNVNASNFISLHWKECAGAGLGVTLLVVGILAHCQVGALNQISQYTLPIACTSYSLGAILIAGTALYSYRAALKKHMGEEKDPMLNPLVPPSHEEPSPQPLPIHSDRLVEVDDDPRSEHLRNEVTTLDAKSYAGRTGVEEKLNKQTMLAQAEGRNQPDLICSSMKTYLQGVVKDTYQRTELHAGVATLKYENEFLDTNLETLINVGKEHACLYSIFDRCEKKEASKLIGLQLKRDLPKKLEKALNKEMITHQDIADAFVGAYLELHTECVEAYKNTGATAISVLATQNFLYVANSGPSRAIFVSDAPIWQSSIVDIMKSSAYDSMVQQLSEDAKPGNPRFNRANEKIVKDGKKGYVHVPNGGQPRIMPSNLEYARKLGNTDVPRRPKITRLPRQNGFVILASDGLWSVASTKQVAGQVRSQRNRGLQVIAQNLLEYALSQGSLDNITVTVIRINKE